MGVLAGVVGDCDGDPDCDPVGDVGGDPLEDGGPDERLEAVGDPDAEWLAGAAGDVRECADEAGGGVPAC